MCHFQRKWIDLSRQGVKGGGHCGDIGSGRLTLDETIVKLLVTDRYGEGRYTAAFEGRAMDDYREDVERLAVLRTGEAFYNSSIDHAAVIIEKMFRHAKSEICIITKQLNGRVFGQDQVVDEARRFLSNANHSVKILMEDGPNSLSEGHPLVQELKQHPAGYEIKRLPNDLMADVQYHFTVADDDSYRFEPNKNEWVAVASFGDKKGAKRLREVFDALWAASDHIDLRAAV